MENKILLSFVIFISILTYGSILNAEREKRGPEPKRTQTKEKGLSKVQQAVLRLEEYKHWSKIQTQRHTKEAEIEMIHRIHDRADEALKSASQSQITEAKNAKSIDKRTAQIQNANILEYLEWSKPNGDRAVLQNIDKLQSIIEDANQKKQGRH
ncbi:MAG: hypothetical protein C5B43_04415 [Verrucomicrobia bacterium]|nr:MAG: hypothetical protein C5B43_04415 [Verrucomicrobiota bacterium]